jgi:hypothetical protein
MQRAQPVGRNDSGYCAAAGSPMAEDPEFIIGPAEAGPVGYSAPRPASITLPTAICGQTWIMPTRQADRAWNAAA